VGLLEIYAHPNPDFVVVVEPYGNNRKLHFEVNTEARNCSCETYKDFGICQHLEIAIAAEKASLKPEPISLQLISADQFTETWLVWCGKWEVCRLIKTLTGKWSSLTTEIQIGEHDCIHEAANAALKKWFAKSRKFYETNKVLLKSYGW
jgi:hypothetical protein